MGPDYVRPAVDTPSAFADTSGADAGAGGLTTSASRELAPGELAQWWERWGDPTLNDLVQKALANNLDLKAAGERVREARALRGVSRSGRFPSVNATGEVSRSRSSDTLGFPGAVGDQNLFDAGFDASWEIDLFGAVRRSVEAADADLAARDNDLAGVRASLAAEVVLAYLDLRESQTLLSITGRSVESQSQTVGLVQARLDAGLGTELDVAQARALLATRESDQPTLAVDERTAMNRLAVLLGEHPAPIRTVLAPPAPIPTAAGDVPVGLPSELLRRRPDIRAAERRIASATARVGVATADLFPRITLNGSLALRSEELSTFLDGDSRAWSFGPSLRWNLFDGGRVRRTIEAADAREKQALLAYQQTVLIALQEVENALIGVSQEQSRLAALDRAIEANRSAVVLAEERYRAGLSEFLNVLESQRRLHDAEDEAVRSRATVMRSLVALCKALGGGWAGPADETAGTPE